MHAAWDESMFLGELYEMLYLVALRDEMERSFGSIELLSPEERANAVE
jgi:hypothetical protein